MIIGYTFDGLSYPAAAFARMTEEMLDYHEGVIEGIELSNTSNKITLGEGRIMIKGRQFEIVESETVLVDPTQSGELYCVLVAEIDLSKESSATNFEQVSFKVLSSATGYTSLTKQDINSGKEENSLYQYEMARFKNSITGIKEFTDKRTFLENNSILNKVLEKTNTFLQQLQESVQTSIQQAQSDTNTLIQQLQQEIENVEDGSAYLLKNNIAIINTVIQTNKVVELSYPTGFYSDSVVIGFGISSPRGDIYSFGIHDGTTVVCGETGVEVKIIDSKAESWAVKIVLMKLNQEA